MPDASGAIVSPSRRTGMTSARPIVEVIFRDSFAKKENSFVMPPLSCAISGCHQCQPAGQRRIDAAGDEQNSAAFQRFRMLRFLPARDRCHDRPMFPRAIVSSPNDRCVRCRCRRRRPPHRPVCRARLRRDRRQASRWHQPLLQRSRKNRRSIAKSYRRFGQARCKHAACER